MILFAGLTPIPSEPWWQESMLVSHFLEIAEWIRNLLPSDMAGRFTF